MDAVARQAVLEAMGYRPYRRRVAGAGNTWTALPATALGAGLDAPGEDSLPDHRRQPPQASRPASASIATESVARPKLLQALLSAAAGEAPEPLGWELVESGPPFTFNDDKLRFNLAALRADAGAKRALWKTLRTLRRQRLETRR